VARLNRPENVTKRDLIIGIACILVVVVAFLVFLWIVGTPGAKSNARLHEATISGAFTDAASLTHR
jgi:hypothetical protein